jgi:hypothetical protein
MSSPLPYGDPARLGPFQLTARLGETPAGITYLGIDPAGRQVSVAVMTRGAAEDAAARDRFRAAILGAGRGGPAPVVAAEPDGPAPWVATAYEPGGPGAERFLDPVLLGATSGGPPAEGHRGPQFRPYWFGSREPAVAVPDKVPAGGPAPDDGRLRRGLVATILSLVAVLALLLVLMSLLYACRPMAVPPPVPTDLPSQPYDPFTPEPSPTPTPAPPTPSPTGTGTATPTDLPGPGDDA